MGISSRHIRESLALTLFEGLLNPKRRTLYVGSTHANASDGGSLGLNPDNPLKTIKQAMVNVRDFANDGHLIVVLPAHVEIVDTAAHIDFDVDNLTIMSQRPDDRAAAEIPKFDFATLTAATLTISGANVRVIGMNFENSIASLVKMVDVTGDGCKLLNCSLNDGALILIDAFVWTGDDGLIDGLHASAPTAGNNSMIQLTGTDSMEISNCRIRADGVAGIIESVTTLSTRYSIHDNELESLDVTDLCIVTLTADTGWIADNRLKIATDGQETWITGDGNVGLYNNKGVNDAGESGIEVVGMGVASVGGDAAPNPKSRTLYVGSTHSGASDSNAGEAADLPLSTIKQAMVNLRLFSDDGHKIVVLPAHVETVNEAVEINFDVDNMSVVSQLTGRAAAEMPKFDFVTSTAATLTISGDNVRIEGMNFENSIASLVKMVDVTGDGCEIINCSLNDGALILIDAFVWTGDDGLIDGLHASAPTAGNNSMIQLTGTDSMEISNCRIRADGVAGIIESVTTLSTRYSIHDNELESLDVTNLCIVTMTADQGWVSNNRLKIATDAIGTWITASGEVALFENYGTNDGAERGVIIGNVSVVT